MTKEGMMRGDASDGRVSGLVKRVFHKSEEKMQEKNEKNLAER